MSTRDTSQPGPVGDGRAPRDEAKRSGEGAQTALQALIRQRKGAEHAEAPEPEPPATPPAA